MNQVFSNSSFILLKVLCTDSKKEKLLSGTSIFLDSNVSSSNLWNDHSPFSCAIRLAVYENSGVISDENYERSYLSKSLNHPKRTKKGLKG